jgi:ArsR family transcriptional regulator, arsenate/arsenite/antimonite-responsive transcriptional repressor
LAGRPSVEERRAAALTDDEALWTALQALADPVRLSIVRLLREREQCVCNLTEVLALSQPTISHHVGLLKRAGLVLDRRDARWTYYRLAPEVAARLSAAVADLLDASQTDPTPAGCHTPATDRGRPEPSHPTLARATTRVGRRQAIRAGRCPEASLNRRAEDSLTEPHKLD